MKRLINILFITILVVLAIAGCAPKAAEEPTVQEPEVEETGDKLDIALIVKATDSGFWQKALDGGKAFGADNENVNVTVYGPASEADVDEQLAILENVITSGPDAIVIASNAGEGANAAIADAAEKGIPVLTIDTSIPSDDVVAHLATDNVLGGALAAEAMVEELEKAGIPLEGKVAIVAAVAGVQTIVDRDGGFIDKMAEIAPDIEVLTPVYVDNEIEKALSETEQIITREGDKLIGIYADNNHTGDGVGRAIKQAGLKDSVMVVAFDDDQEELDFLAEGVIKALIIQDPFNMGYAGCEYAVKAAKGEEIPAFIDTGVNVTRAEQLGVEPEADATYDIALIVKATDSGFWQKALDGGKAFGADNENVNVTVYGPASEADVDEQLAILENVITSGPDAIVIASNAGEGANAAIAEAAEKGIPVLTIDTSIPSDDVVAHLATDNVLGGALAAEAMVEELEKAGIPLEGKVAIVAAVAGVQTIVDRDGGFIDKMAEIAPDIEVLTPVYVDNEIEKALSETEQIITREGDKLIGIYADNNHTGDGVGRAIKQAGLKDSVIIVAFDDDQEELDFLAEGVIKALIIQDPFNMGYAGCEYAVKALKGEKIPAFIDTGVNVTRAEDL
ncbi:MAG: ABC transporter substrate-binding protein [Brevefilum sp.]|jgi:ribose transport system substrate-binding protein